MRHRLGFDTIVTKVLQWGVPKKGSWAMKRIMVAMMLMGAALVLASGVAWAATVNCQVGVFCEGTDEPDELIGTSKRDVMSGLQDDDRLVGFMRADEMYGDDPEPGGMTPEPTATMSSLATAAMTLCSASGAPTISGAVAGTTS
jgi:hypothetical protein